jgi:EF-P beta-lysylation protein EpmB|tara:strand:- start:50382 stop:51383 length:1002 start_codon:yes stop_codon:yes gene_type:complete
MIPQTDISWQEESWQSALKNLVTDADELCELLGLNPEQLNLSAEAAKKFQLKVPRSFVARMEPGNADDPLLRQVLNLKNELIQTRGFVKDPLQENEANPLPGLIHKYKNRVLLTVSGACAIHCRYCFRRHFDYEANNPGSDGWLPVLRYIQEHPEIDEVIFSGGDPLSAPDRVLKNLTERLLKITSVKRLRVHTRFPLVIPQRITEDCLEWLKLFPNTVAVLHINHANEIDEPVVKTILKMKSAGLVLLNQAVLLKGVNDSLKEQLALHQSCFDLGIQPYYLHLLDPVDGSAHFDIPKDTALNLYEGMRGSLSGYMLPKLVQETPGDISKTRL